MGASTDLEVWFSENFIDSCDSGWWLSKILKLQGIKPKSTCVNVQNYDKACFVWALVSALFPADRSSERTSKHPMPGSVLNLRELEFPVHLKQISKFEKANDISMNVYCSELVKKIRIKSSLRQFLSDLQISKFVDMLTC